LVSACYARAPLCWCCIGSAATVHPSGGSPRA